MHFEKLSFGSISIDGVTYEHDVVIDRGQVGKRKEKAIQEVSRRVWAHAAIRQREDTLEMPTVSDRYGNGCAASNETSEAGSHAPQNQIGRASYCAGNRGIEREPGRNQRDPARYLLNPWSTTTIRAASHTLDMPGHASSPPSCNQPSTEL